MIQRVGIAVVVLGMALVRVIASPANDLPRISFIENKNDVQILIDDHPVAKYVFFDSNILRPYFADIRTLDGSAITRNHPPLAGVDPVDHDRMHPGIWLAFGDLSGSDFWRNQGKVCHEAFVVSPKSEADFGTFTVRNRYWSPQQIAHCEEICQLSFAVKSGGYFLLWDSTFSSDASFYFGDQEEMGLGIRMATSLSAQEGGTINDANGRRGEKNVWGTSSTWCNYAGMKNYQMAGVAVMSHPNNWRSSWHHARNYGLLVANPFGRHAFHQGDADRTVVQKGDKLRLRFGLYVYAQPSEKLPDINLAWSEYLRFAESYDNNNIGRVQRSAPH